jgi:hypothetical protein
MNYTVECSICDSVTEVFVKYGEERPECCPMCGADAVDVTLEDEDFED